jgi:hypothetical protein
MCMYPVTQNGKVLEETVLSLFTLLPRRRQSQMAHVQ